MRIVNVAINTTRLFQNARTISYAFAVLSMLLVACGGDDKAATPKDTPTPKIETIADVLKKMQVVFVGDYRVEEIKGKVAASMAMYQLPETPENYTRVADVLVALRKSQGPREMAILDEMMRNYTPAVNLKFQDAAAFAVTSLVVNPPRR